MSPNWHHVLDISDVWDREDRNPQKVASAVYSRTEGLLKSRWIQDIDWLADLREDLLQISEDPEADADDFDYVWSNFYDWADMNRVWVNIWLSK